MWLNKTLVIDLEFWQAGDWKHSVIYLFQLLADGKQSDFLHEENMHFLPIRNVKSENPINRWNENLGKA